jgi:hypothetical protein
MMDLPSNKASSLSAKSRHCISSNSQVRHHTGGQCLSIIAMPVCESCHEAGHRFGDDGSTADRFVLI